MSLRRVRVIPVLALALAASLLATLAAPAPAHAAGFPDTAGQTYSEAVDVLAAAGIVQGDTEGRFNPDRRLTRGQTATILAAALDLAEPAALPFEDSADHPHADGIAALAEAEITNGCELGRFCPDEPITRAELATLLVRAFEVPPATAEQFDDVSGTHADSIHALAEAGISAGCSVPVSGFCPSDVVLRWQAAYFVARALHLVDRVDIAPLAERRQAEADRVARIEAEREAARRAEEEARRAAEAAAERERIWDRLAQCESGGNWAINTGNGYYGGLQFSLQSWRAVGGSGFPHQHTRAEQIRRGERLQAIQGWGAWPSCSRQLGLR